MAEVTLDAGKIKDWHSFHMQSAEVFGFPDFYGHNLNAWIDCLTYLPEGDGMSRFVLDPEEQLVINLPQFAGFAETQAEICLAFLGCVALINQRYASAGDIPRLVLVPQ